MHIPTRSVLAAFALAAGAPGADAQPSGPPPANVQFGEVKSELLQQLREVTGEVRALRRSLVAAEEAGRVESVAVEAGDRVVAGQVLAQLDDSLAKIGLARAQAELASRRGLLDERRAELDRAARELSRYSALGERAASESLVDEWRMNELTGKSKLVQAEADVKHAEADLGEAQRRLDRLTIKAPFAGRVVSKRTEAGAWANPGSPVAEILATHTLEVRLDIPELYVGAIKEGQTAVTLRFPALQRETMATVASIIPDADSLSRLVPVRLTLPNSSGEFWAGMTVTGLIATGQQALATTIPKDAILRDDAGEYVYFDANGSAMPARIKRLYALADRVAIEPAVLQPGMRVITDGNIRVFPGQPLNNVGHAQPAK